MKHHTDPAINAERRIKRMRPGLDRQMSGVKEQQRHAGDVTCRTEREALRAWCARHNEAQHQAQKSSLSVHWTRHNAQRAAKR